MTTGRVVKCPIKNPWPRPWNYQEAEIHLQWLGENSIGEDFTYNKKDVLKHQEFLNSFNDD